MSFTIVCVGSGDVGRSALTAALLARDFHRIWLLFQVITL